MGKYVYSLQVDDSNKVEGSKEVAKIITTFYKLFLAEYKSIREHVDPDVV